MCGRHIVSAVAHVLTFAAASVTFAETITKADHCIESTTLAATLDCYAAERGLQFVYLSKLLRDLPPRTIPNRPTVEETLRELLKGTGVTFEYVNKRTITLIDIPAASPAEPVQPDPKTAPDELVPTVVIRHTKFSYPNAAIAEATLDDPQPYVVFDREDLKRSGALDLGQALKDLLPMNAQSGTPGQFGHALGNISEVNLRGYGTDETVILVNGRRIASTVFQGEPTQADINGIPSFAIDSVSVLPLSASGMYGGSATGGVVDIRLRNDFTGLEGSVTYDSSFAGESAFEQINLGFGNTFSSGRTSVVGILSASDSSNLLAGRVGLLSRGRAAILANNPDFYRNSELPPLGNRPNLRTLDGSPLDGVDGPAITTVPEGYQSSDGAEPLLLNAGQYNLQLADTAQIDGSRRSLVTATKSTAALMRLEHKFNDRWDAFFEGSTTRKRGEYLSSEAPPAILIPETAPSNPFGKNLLLNIPIPELDGVIRSDVSSHRASGGVRLMLFAGWVFEADHTWSQFVGHHFGLPRLDEVALFTALEEGRVDLLRDLVAFRSDLSQFVADGEKEVAVSTANDTVFRVNGPVPFFRGRDMRLSFQLERYYEVFAHQVRSADGWNLEFPEQSVRTNSAYLEALLPLHDRFEVQVAGRLDDYVLESASTLVEGIPVSRTKSDFSAFNPAFGLAYRPFGSLMLRASYATGFRPPSVTQISPITNGGGSIGALGQLGLVDPRRGNSSVDFGDYVEGGNPHLRPEESESWSAGIVLKPHLLKDLRFSIDYVRIKKTNNIESFSADPQVLLENERLFPDRVRRSDPLPGDPAAWPGPVIWLDNTMLNVSQTTAEAYDLQIDYKLQTKRLGTFTFNVLASIQTHFTTQKLPDLPEEEKVAWTHGNPLKHRGNASIIWSRGSLAIGSTLRYFGRYRVSDDELVEQNQGAEWVSSQNYVDGFASYEFSDSARLNALKDLELQIRVRNLFNAKPPYDAGSFAYYSPFGDPRLSSWSVTLRKQF